MLAPGVRLKFDFTESRFVLRNVLLQDVHERLGLLRAEIDALKILDVHLLRHGLIHQAEQQQKIPQIHPDLHAVGIALAVIGAIYQVDFRLRLLAHRFKL